MAAAEVGFIGVWNRPQRSELSSAAGLGVHCLVSKPQPRRKLSIRAEKTHGVEKGKALMNFSYNHFLLGKNNVFLILKAVQNGSIGGAQSIIQQIYNLKDIPIPLLDASYSVVNEIKKRMAFPWQEEGERDLQQKSINTVIASLESTQLESPKMSNYHGARCVLPRTSDSFPMPDKLSSRAESVMGVTELNRKIHGDVSLHLQATFTQGDDLFAARDVAYPRCSWPRKESKSANSPLYAAASSAPRCAWPRAPPRVASNTHFQEQLLDRTSKKEGTNEGKSNIARSAGGDAITNFESSSLYQQKTGCQSVAGPRCVWPNDRVSGKASDEKRQEDPDSGRPIFPSDFPRRMLATSVCISLMNYLLVGHGTSALAFPGDFLHSLDTLPSRKPNLVAK